jgi:hypothetical protein
MAGFTLPAIPGQGEFYADFPVFVIVDLASVPGRAFLQTTAYTTVRIPLYTEEEHARQAIADLALQGCVPHAVPDAPALVALLRNASPATGATHVAIDVGNRFTHGTGRIRSVQELIDAVEAG